MRYIFNEEVENMFHKFPYVKQHDEKECGICCLLMMIRYYHGNYSLKELSELSHTTQKGTTAYHLLEASKSVGFIARGVSCDLNKVSKNELLLPCIAHVMMDYGGHYVVIYKISFSKQELWVVDPALGYKKYSFIEFQKIWSGTLLLMYPKEKIEFHKEENLLNYFSKVLIVYRILFLQIIFLSFMITIFSIGTSYYIKLMIEFLSKHYSINIFIWSGLFFGILYVIKNISSYFRNVLFNYLAQKIDIILFLKTFEHLLHLPYSLYRNKTTGDMIHRIQDVTILKNIFLKFMMSVTIDSSLCLVSLFILFFIHQTLGFIAIIMIFLYFTHLFLFQPWIQKKMRKVKQKQSKLSSVLTETILGIESLKGLHLEIGWAKNLEKNLLPVIEENFNLEQLLQRKNLFSSILKDTSFCLVVASTVSLIYQKKLSLESLFLVQSLFMYSLDSIENIVNMMIEWKEGKIAFQRFVELFHEDKTKATFNTLDLKQITCQNVTYKEEQQMILSKLSCQIRQKERILLIGESGSGKSSFLKLLMKYDECSSGKILFNKINMKHYKKESFISNISYLSQNELLFTTTLYDNIVMNREYEEEDLKRVLSFCEIDSIVKEHPLGYKMFIEENGFNLSGGERQRIILARYLLKPTSFILIDEGFSQMDTSLERRILKRMFRYYSKQTFIIVSHRLDNVDLFSRMIRLQKGKIIEDVSK